MSKERFDCLLSKVATYLMHRHYGSSSVCPAERLALTCRFLATGNSQGCTTVFRILKETYEVLWTTLCPEYVHAPPTSEEWKKISREFSAIDGKYIVLQAQVNAGSLYYDYKGSHSIVLLAVRDAYYKFVLADFGEAGWHSDGGIPSNSSFGEALEAGCLSIPDKSPLPGTSRPFLPYVIVGDEAFLLKENIMRPYPGRYLPEDKVIFNYRLSRARRVLENTFGILAARWCIFR